MTDARMYRALVERDGSFEGVFVVGVRTTAIFCRPTCPARKPRRENVEFFTGGVQALHAGYRPCLRCRPLEDAARAKAAPKWLVELKSRAERSPRERLRDADLRERGLDPSTVRRLFQRHYGMTFQAFARARRVGLALSTLRKAGKGKDRMSSAQATAGFASESGFREAVTRLFGDSKALGAKGRTLLARWIETPLGAMLAMADDQGLRLLDFVDRRGLERQVTRIRTSLRCAIIPGEHPTLDAVETGLRDYFAGREAFIGLPLAPGLGGTEFQRSVWAELRRIPMGQTRSYAQQAAAIGKAGAVRAVARANGENFLGLVVPCHRVIGADGSMTGYGGGVWRKKWLLDHERGVAGALTAGAA
ncbi:MAG: methylated-DNA--[protein]-cysteine S-methyltransferase [Planctomycetota bacterium]